MAARTLAPQVTVPTAISLCLGGSGRAAVRRSAASACAFAVDACSRTYAGASTAASLFVASPASLFVASPAPALAAKLPVRHRLRLCLHHSLPACCAATRIISAFCPGDFAALAEAAALLSSIVKLLGLMACTCVVTVAWFPVRVLPVIVSSIQVAKIECNQPFDLNDEMAGQQLVCLLSCIIL